MKLRHALVAIVLLTGCSTSVPTPNLTAESRFPQVRGITLDERRVTLPEDFAGKPVVLLVGYIQRAQFDIDRWILGLLQSEAKVEIIEVPTISGMVPTILQDTISNGMRSGIPKEDWGVVVTVFEDADKIIGAIGNERPQSASVVLLDRDGRIAWLYNQGYSPHKVLELRDKAAGLGDAANGRAMK